MIRGVCGGVLAVLCLLPASAQDDKKWNEAMATWQRLSGSKEAVDRARAVEEIGGATYDKRDKQCVNMVLAMLRSELARDKQGKNEENVANDVLDACVAAFKKITNAEAVAELIKTATNKGEAPRVKLYVIWGLGGISGDAVDKALVQLVDDKTSSMVQIAAIDSLKERGSKQLDLYLRILKEERPWEVKLSALLAIDKCIGEKDEAAIDTLIEGMAKVKADEGRLIDEYKKILTRLIGEVKSDEPGAWKAAWAAKKSGKDPVKEGGTVAEPTEFFGLKTKSTRIVFVLDRTGSMAAPLNHKDGGEKKPPKNPPISTGKDGKENPMDAAARGQAEELKKKYDNREVKTRMDALKKEFINTIYYMDPKVHFTVVWYEANQQPWKDQLVPAT
jgi:hypothetical protein